MSTITAFGFETTAAEVVEGLDLSGKRAIVTGGASGIGIETARALAGAGADVTLAVRDLEAGERVAAAIDADVAPLELADPASVDAFVREWDGPLDILVNNAGVMALPELTTSAAGYELQFHTNHLGHFQLAVGLHAALAAAPDGGRIVSVSSSGHLRSPIVWDDIHFAFRPYDPWLAYGQSKTANVLFAVEATRRWSDDGIVANALMPGGIMTNLQRHVSEEGMRRLRAGSSLRFKTPEQGAATSVLVAASPALDGIGGRYFEDCAVAPVVDRRPEGNSGAVARYALDPEGASRLWEVSERMLA
jgi:NAD(P)-dependent dehydrogenase (short-subunit alcohol dehydrogenase family)